MQIPTTHLLSIHQEQYPPETRRAVGITRLLTGLLQGGVLYVLSFAIDGKNWLSIHNTVLVPLLLIASLVPLILTQAAGNMRTARLLIWGALATVLLAILGYYDVWRRGALVAFGSVNNFPSTSLVIFSVAGLFIAHALIVSGDMDRRFMARYSTYFDVAWKQALQIILSAVFLGIFWALLWLGASLFDLIKLHILTEVITKRWFTLPVSTLIFAAALHVTDVRAGLVRGLRTLALVLLSWLLPLITVIVVGFFISLVFKGLSALWQTEMTMAMLLGTATTLIILINTCYQDGNAERIPPRMLRYTATLAALLLAPLIALAVYALYIRVMQYGWTENRIIATVWLVITFSYTLGYILAAFKRGPWFKLIAAWNFVTALLILAAILVLFTPLADPARLAVTNQITRLQSGQVAPQQFDFRYLKDVETRFGAEALEHLQHNAQGSQAAYIRAQAKAMLMEKNNIPPIQVTPETIATMINVHTPGSQLPSSFLHQQWNNMSANIPYCLLYVTVNKCDAWIMDINHDGKDEIIIADLEGTRLIGFQYNAQHVWQVIGTWNIPYNCPTFSKAAKSGQFQMIPPKPSPWPDIEIMGKRFPFAPPDTVIGKFCAQ